MCMLMSYMLLLSLYQLIFFFFFFLSIRPPPKSPLFPYTPLFRSTTRLNSSHTIICMPSSAWSSDVCRSEEHTSELQSHDNLVCRLLLEKTKQTPSVTPPRPPSSHSTTPSRPAASRTGRCGASEARPPRGARGRRPRGGVLFFLNKPAPPDSSPLPLPAAFRI